MLVYIENKLISLRGSSTIKDENGKVVYYVKGKLISPTHKKFIQDSNNKTLFMVRNKWLRFISHSAFVYDEHKNKIARVKLPAFSVKKFVIQGYKDEIVINGKFFSLESQIMRNGKVIGTIRRQINLLKDAFSLEAEEEDMPFLIALVICIDNIYDRISDDSR